MAINLKQFIPQGLVNWLTNGKNSYNFRNYSMIGQKGEVYLNFARPREIYDTIPQARIVINKDSMMFANMVLKVVDKSGKTIDDEPLNKLI